MSVTPAIFGQKLPYRAPCGVCADCDVRRMAVCAVLDDGDLGALEAIMISRRLDANEMLVEEGEPKRRVFSLTSGLLRIYTSLPDGRRQIAGFLFRAIISASPTMKPIPNRQRPLFPPFCAPFPRRKWTS